MEWYILLAAIFGIGIVVGVPVLYFILRQGNVAVVVWEFYSGGFKKKKHRGLLKEEDGKQTLKLYKGVFGHVDIEGPIYREPDGTVNIAKTEDGQYVPLRLDVDVERIKAEPVLNPATKLAILRATERLAQRTVEKKGPSLLSHPATLLFIAGFITIALISLTISPIKGAVDANTKAVQALQTTLHEFYSQGNVSHAIQPTPAGGQSPFQNRKPPA